MQGQKNLCGMSNSQVVEALTQLQQEHNNSLSPEHRQLLDTEFSYDASMLDDKHNPNGDGEHPVYPRAEWRNAVAANDTIIGYWDWVEYRIEQYHATTV
jgi:hypothetical protein